MNQGGVWGSSYSKNYIIDNTTPTVTASPNGGLFNSTQTVTLNATDLLTNTTIFYTTDGSNPETSNTSNIYNNQITINNTTTLDYMAVNQVGTWSQEYTQTYTIDNLSPIASSNLNAGTYNTTQTATLTSNDPNAAIYYTEDTTNPITSITAILYTGPLNINQTTTLRYAALNPFGTWSPLYTVNYEIGNGTGINNTGQSYYTGPQTNNTIWTFATGTITYSTSVVGSDGTIYIGSTNDNLYAINPNGTLKWSYTTGNKIYSTPTIGADGTIYIASLDDYLYAINPNGTLKWKYKTGNQIASSPVISADGTIYIASTDDNLYAINSNGTLKWKYTSGSYYDGLATPSIGSDGTIYFGTVNSASSNGFLYAINPDGTLEWSYNTLLVQSAPILASNGTIYIGGYRQYSTNDLYAISSNGTLIWSYVVPGSNNYIMSWASASNGNIYVGTTHGILYALNSNGTQLWSYTEGSGQIRSMVIGSDGTIYSGCGSTITALNSNGTLKWTSTTGGTISGSVDLSPNGTLYVGSNAIYAFKDVPPVANFTASQTTGGVPIKIQFTDDSPSTTSWYWNFGDGTTSILQNPTHTYTAIGNYTVTETVTGPGGNSSTTLNIILSPIPPVVNFTATNSNGSSPLIVQFTDESQYATSWLWNFGDGTNSTLENPIYTYNKTGIYTVTETVTNPYGNNSLTQINFITVNDNRLINPDFETGDFTGWAVGSTTEITTNAHSGQYAAHLDFSGSQSTDFVQQNVDLTNVNSISFWGYGESTTWPFYVYIDGNLVQSPNAVYNTWTQYIIPTSNYTGIHTISIKWNGDAAYGADIDDFSMNITPTANFTANTTNGTAPLTVQFTDQSTGTVGSYYWDFGDGVGTSTQQNPNYTYTTIGTYSVTETVTGPDGNNTLVQTNYITVSSGLLNLSSINPANGTANVAYNQPITLTFNEPIQAGNAIDAITVTGSDGVARYITKTITGSTLTITPLDNWTPGTIYTITIPAYAVTDQNGVVLTTPYTSTFNTGQTLAISSVNPANGTSNVANNQPITLTFNEPIQTGNAIDAVTVTGSDGVARYITKTITGDTLTITPLDNWTPGTTYTITIPPNAVTDQNGIALTTPYTSTFNTGQTLAISRVNPANGTSNVANNQTIILTFNEPIKAGGAIDAITVTGSDGIARYINKTITGDTLTITPLDNWNLGTTYTITIPPNAVTDQNGIALTAAYNSTFNTTTAPTITSADPTNGTSNVAINKTITLTFNEPIQAGGALDAITVTGSDGVARYITKTIQGNTLTITPLDNWNLGTNYTITIPTNAVTDQNGIGLTEAYTSTFST